MIVNVKVVEGDRSRVQAYEGVCIGRSGGGLNESFTVRKISYGEGVERVFPVMSPMIDSIKVVRRGKVRRAKLYYLRNLRGKSARIVEKTDRATDRPRPPSASNRCAPHRLAFRNGPAHAGPFSFARGLTPASRSDGGDKRISRLRYVLCYKAGMVPDQTSMACKRVERVVIDDRSRLPGRFFGRFTTSATSELGRPL